MGAFKQMAIDMGDSGREIITMSRSTDISYKIAKALGKSFYWYISYSVTRSGADNAIIYWR